MTNGKALSLVSEILNSVKNLDNSLKYTVLIDKERVSILIKKNEKYEGVHSDYSEDFIGDIEKLIKKLKGEENENN